MDFSFVCNYILRGENTDKKLLIKAAFYLWNVRIYNENLYKIRGLHIKKKFISK